MKTAKGRKKGFEHSEETKKRIGEAHKGKYISSEIREKISNSLIGNKNALGHVLPEEIKEKLRQINKGKHLSKEVRRKISERNKGKISAMKGRHQSEEAKKKISNKLSGRKLSEEHKRKLSIPSWRKGKKYEELYNKEKADKIKLGQSLALMGRYFSGETRKKLSLIGRKARFKYLQKFNIRYPCIGRFEKEILDELEYCFGYKIQRQKWVAGYFVDGYCIPLNLVIEIDESFHNKNIIKDFIREDNIKKELNCLFLRIPVEV